MNKYIIYNILFVLVALASCRDHEDLEKHYFPPETTDQARFAEQFTKMYGEVASDITWITASESNATLDLSGLDKGNYTIQFYTADPRNDADFCYLLTEYQDIESGVSRDLAFDYPTGLKKVYVTAVANSGKTFTLPLVIGTEETTYFDGTIVDVNFFEHEAMRYRMCFEGFTEEGKDLDFDYNDLVTEIEYVRGRNTVIVNVLAAGCECFAQLALRRSATLEKGDDEILFDEAHAALGYKGEYSYFYDRVVYLMLNTGLNNVNKIGTTTFQLNEDQGISITKLAHQFFAYFKLPSNGKTEEDNKNKPTASFIPQKPGSQSPQAILIANPNWDWTYEGIILSASYSLFRYWILEPTKYPFWYGGECWEKANELSDL